MFQFPQAIHGAHGEDITVSEDLSPSRANTPVTDAPQTASQALTAASSQAITPLVPEPREPINTVTVIAEATFMAPADNLFRVLTDEKRNPIWSHASAEVRTHLQSRVLLCFCY
jgi:activator of HSP90 ATPase